MLELIISDIPFPLDEDGSVDDPSGEESGEERDEDVPEDETVFIVRRPLEEAERNSKHNCQVVQSKVVKDSLSGLRTYPPSRLGTIGMGAMQEAR